VYDGGNLSVHGERECEREKNDGEIQMQEPGEREQVLDGRRGEKVQDVPRGERNDKAHVERMRRNEREGGKGTGRNTERRRKGDTMDERNMEEGSDREEEGWEIRIKMIFMPFLGIVTFVNCCGFVHRNPLKRVREIKFYYYAICVGHSRHKEPNLHTNELNTTGFFFDEPLKGSTSLKIFKISLTFRFDML
jgi:hypothetical protein